VIGLDGDIWSARFHGSADELRAHTSTELRELIRADYAYRQQVGRVRAAAAGTEAAGDALDDHIDDDDYAAHFDGAQIDTDQIDTDEIDTGRIGSAGPGPGLDADNGRSPGGGHRDDTEPDRQAGPGGASLPRVGYANFRGERMST
jgi:hypothetical protein